ncbi:hypothetical protein BC831DRAFT_155725 [Entophlyctis helioformis]|nr:hypothetical protein BC831DRAFT_155725 [Entophlyctis helioformis]
MVHRWLTDGGSSPVALHTPDRCSSISSIDAAAFQQVVRVFGLDPRHLSNLLLEEQGSTDKAVLLYHLIVEAGMRRSAFNKDVTVTILGSADRPLGQAGTPPPGLPLPVGMARAPGPPGLPSLPRHPPPRPAAPAFGVPMPPAQQPLDLGSDAEAERMVGKLVGSSDGW